MDSSSSFVCYLIATGFDSFIGRGGRNNKRGSFKTEYPHFHLVDAIRILGVYVGRHFLYAFKIPLERVDKTPWKILSSAITGTVPVSLCSLLSIELA